MTYMDSLLLRSGFPSWPSYSQEEADIVGKVLLSNRVNYWTGEETRCFETEFAEYIGCNFAVAVANGTVAIDLALKALNVGADDEVIVTPRTFVGSASSIVNAGATPVFADVDADTQNLSAETIAAVLTPRTRAILIVHLAGMPADMDPIMKLAKQNGIKVIEDCAQAHGAAYKGRSVGSIGDIGTWSFCQEKIITTGGEGGMVTTNDQSLWSAMWSYKDHGKSWDAVYKSSHEDGFRWLHESFGTNWRLTDMQGALGRYQLKLLPKWTAARQNNAYCIWNTCKNIDWLRVPAVPSHVTHAAYKAYVFVIPERLPEGCTRDALVDALVERNVPAYTGSCSEVYLEKAFQNTTFMPKQPLPVARELGETSIMFPVHPTLQKRHLDRICNALTTLNANLSVATVKARQSA